MASLLVYRLSDFKLKHKNVVLNDCEAGSTLEYYKYIHMKALQEDNQPNCNKSRLEDAKQTALRDDACPTQGALTRALHDEV